MPETNTTYYDSRPSRLPLEHCVEHWITERSIEFVEECRCLKRPFCMEVSLPRPHPQLTPDQRFWDMYPEDIEAPSTLEQDVSHRPPHFQKIAAKLKQHKWLFPPDEFHAGSRRVWRGYLGCITQIDYFVGKLLDHLESTGLAHNTIVVFGADHGAFNGMHAVQEKSPGLSSEAVCRVPFIWRVPGVSQTNIACKELVENVDLAPTVTALCGLPPMESTDGKNITSLLRGESVPVREVAVTENPWSKALRWERWRYVHYVPEMFSGAQMGELYDIEADPLEAINLYLSAQHQEIVAECRNRLLNWIMTTTRVVTCHPSLNDATMGIHAYATAGDGKESNLVGPAERVRRGLRNCV